MFFHTILFWKCNQNIPDSIHRLSFSVQILVCFIKLFHPQNFSDNLKDTASFLFYLSTPSFTHFIKRSLYEFENYVAQPLIPKTLHVHSPVSQLPASFSVTLLMFLEPHLASDTLLARCIFIIASSSTGHHCSSLRGGKLQRAGQMQSTTCFCK